MFAERAGWTVEFGDFETSHAVMLAQKYVLHRMQASSLPGSKAALDIAAADARAICRHPVEPVSMFILQKWNGVINFKVPADCVKLVIRNHR
ncbi:hypothetical protein J1614_000069 [Plenodomus biglobosus]|nr:hypothetical protein J1614_000069 [Plenodomus biglobosus]